MRVEILKDVELKNEMEQRIVAALGSIASNRTVKASFFHDLSPCCLEGWTPEENQFFVGCGSSHWKAK